MSFTTILLVSYYITLHSISTPTIRLLTSHAGFLEKNRDTVNIDLRELITHTTNPFLQQIFVGDQSGDSTRRTVSLSQQFRRSLETLMRTLADCHPFFIRCVKPNEFKKPNVSLFCESHHFGLSPF